jgi:hypothetical protein
MNANAFETAACKTEIFVLGAAALFARGVNVQKERRCPNCNSVIYSRRHRVCGACLEPLPVSCLFSDRESEHVASLLEDERQRHRRWLSKANFGG